MVERPGQAFAGRPAGMTIRTSGSIPTTATSFCWSATRSDHHRQRRPDVEFWYNQPTAQLYHAIADSSFLCVCAGQQRAVGVYRSRGNDGVTTFRDWHPVGVIEYGYVAPDPLDPDVVYGGGRTEVSGFTGQRGKCRTSHRFHARPEVPRQPHRAIDVLSRRSARPLLRNQCFV